MSAAASIHDKLTIVDGLIFWSDGTSDSLSQGNVAAANVTVCGFQSDFPRAADELASWRHILSKPDSTWHHVRSVDDIDVARMKGKVGLIMGFQNLRPIDDRIERLAFFHDAGVRIMQLTYNERNAVGDGCLEDPAAGLSSFGKLAIDEMNRLGIAIDLSHVSERTCFDAIERSKAPVLVTHANAKAVLDVPRNKSDRLLKEVAARGGTVGACIHGFMCWDGDPRRRASLADYVKHISYLRDLVGIGHIAMGTDFPCVISDDRADEVLKATAARYAGVAGFSSKYVAAFGNTLASRYPQDCNSPRDLRRLTDALLAARWSEDDLKAFYGANLMQALRTIWRAPQAAK